MPFKVTFYIYAPGKLAPDFSTDDRKLAYVELNARRAKQGQAMTRMSADVLVVSLELESALDKQISSARAFLNSHPGYPVKDEKGHAFFLVVEAWREAWHERKKFSQKKGYDLQVYKEMTRKIRDYESKIDMYIKGTIGL